MRRPVVHAAVALALACGLAACSSPAPGPAMTAEEAGERVASLGARAGDVLADPALGELGQALGTVLPAGLPPADGHALPRGVYELDEASGTWTLVGPSDDLDLGWAADPGDVPARLLVDWDAASPTVTRTLASGDEVELPTGASATLTLDGEVASALEQTATWPENECGTLTEPGDLYLSGQLTHGDATLAVDDVGLSVDAGPTSATLTGSGGLDLTVPAGRAWSSWDAELSLNVTRDEVTCEVTDAAATSGRLRFDAGVETGDGGGSLGFATDFAPVSDPSAPPGVALANGRLTIDGALAVTWEGVLNDADGDGVPGEDLVLTFEDGTTTLEGFLRERFGLALLGSRVLAALR